MMYNFYPRPPRGGRRSCLMISGVAKAISIHALREEGDVFKRSGTLTRKQFLSTPSARRATRRQGKRLGYDFGFLSTPSARRATGGHAHALVDGLFLSTPSARRATRPMKRAQATRPISIHALREEGDITVLRRTHCRPIFLSTPSARRATGDGNAVRRADPDFYPRPPRGERRSGRRTLPKS